MKIMLTLSIWKRPSVVRCCRSCIHSQPPSTGQHKIKKPNLHDIVTKEEKLDVKRIRNIGIIAHIDAGKTTTTERMLFLSGATKSMGNVDSGDTVTDYMAQERERGITITSAAITFYWNHYRINLIDTPGHVDFTLEVERSLRVLDGAVIVVDSAKGIEAQTLTVWRQAKKFNIPSVIYLNKMDKPMASHEKCLKSIQDKLKITPLLINSPLGEGKSFRGVTDLISMENLEWTDDDEGKKYKVTKLEKEFDNYDKAVADRDKLIGSLADLDSEFGDIMLKYPSTLNIPSSSIDASLRKATLSRQILPVLCGSSLKKKAVQPILNAVCKYLPNPNERRHAFVPFYGANNLCALAFKIVNDHFLGRLTFLRVYNGEITPNMKIYNVNKDSIETVQRVYIPHSDEMQQSTGVTAGNIAVVPGFTSTITGDTLVKDVDTAKLASQAFEKFQSEKKGNLNVDEVDTTVHNKLVLANIEAPDPVFFCSIEPPSVSSQKVFDSALQQLVREDPSLRVRVDPESLQTILEGMGELQIEIVKDRLLREFDLKVFLGPVFINYREAISETVEHVYELTEHSNQKEFKVLILLRAQRRSGAGMLKSIDLGKLKGDENMLSRTPAHYLNAIRDGCINACLHGPTIGYPVMDVHVTLRAFTCSTRTPIALVHSCANVCLSQLMKKAGSQVLEPIMKLEISVPEQYANQVVSDMTKRRANIDDSQWIQEDNLRIMTCTAPLAELVGFAKSIRTLSSGTADFHMQLAGYETMSAENVENLKSKLSGSCF